MCIHINTLGICFTNTGARETARWIKKPVCYISKVLGQLELHSKILPQGGKKRETVVHICDPSYKNCLVSQSGVYRSAVDTRRHCLDKMEGKNQLLMLSSDLHNALWQVACARTNTRVNYDKQIHV